MILAPKMLQREQSSMQVVLFKEIEVRFNMLWPVELRACTEVVLSDFEYAICDNYACPRSLLQILDLFFKCVLRHVDRRNYNSFALRLGFKTCFVHCVFYFGNSLLFVQDKKMARALRIWLQHKQFRASALKDATNAECLLCVGLYLIVTYTDLDNLISCAFLNKAVEMTFIFTSAHKMSLFHHTAVRIEDLKDVFIVALFLFKMNRDEVFSKLKNYVS